MVTDGGWEAKRSSLPNIYHPYPTVMKLGTVIPYLKKTHKLYKSRDTPSDFCWFQPFFIGNQQFLLYQDIQIQIAFLLIVSNSFNFSWDFKDFLINMVIILMMSAKIATPGLPKIVIFWSKVYDVAVLFDDVTNKFLSRYSNYIVDMFMWPKFGNCSISVREVITTLIL